jgi:hypothetical protein
MKKVFVEDIRDRAEVSQARLQPISDFINPSESVQVVIDTRKCREDLRNEMLMKRLAASREEYNAKKAKNEAENRLVQRISIYGSISVILILAVLVIVQEYQKL